jgi:hypothetical protein
MGQSHVHAGTYARFAEPALGLFGVRARWELRARTGRAPGGEPPPLSIAAEGKLTPSRTCLPSCDPLRRSATRRHGHPRTTQSAWPARRFFRVRARSTQRHQGLRLRVPGRRLAVRQRTRGARDRDCEAPVRRLDTGRRVRACRGNLDAEVLEDAMALRWTQPRRYGTP